MLKKDKLLVEQLTFTEDAMRATAAEKLDKLEKGHFEDHPVSRRLIKELQPALVASHAGTASQLVRKWIVQVLADGGATGKDIDALVLESLVPQCTYLPTLLYYVWSNKSRFQEHKEKVKTLHAHPEPQVRWRCALVLESMPDTLSYDQDITCLRQLALDSNYNARNYAVLAMRHIGIRAPADTAVLGRVIETDDGAAQYHARQLLAESGTTC